MRKHGRTDSNHTQVISAMRQMGATVTSLASLGKGVPDILVSYRGGWKLCEIKDGSKPPCQRKLTHDESKWINNQKAPVYLIESVQDAIDLINGDVSKILNHVHVMDVE